MHSKAKQIKSQKGLQKVTETEYHAEIEKLFKKKQLSEEDIKFLKSQNHDKLSAEMNEHFKKLPEGERLNFLNLIHPIADENLRNQTYEYNHLRIMQIIHNYLNENRCVPSVNEISTQAGISRKTVYQHLQDFDTSKYYKLEKRKEKIIGTMIKDKLPYFAIRGDMKAAKLYFQLTGQLQQATAPMSILQINNTFIDVKVLQGLPEESKAIIEATIQKELSKQNSINDSN